MPEYEAAIQDFSRSGWAHLRGFVADQTLQRLCNYADDAATTTSGEVLRYHECLDGRRILSRVENHLVSHPVATELLTSELLGLLRILFAGEPVLFKDKLNYKPPHGGAFTTHQDGPAYAGFGITCFITVMFAIDDATCENGCLEFAAGRRTRHELPVDDNGQLKAGALEGLTFAPCPTSAGDIVIFDGLAPHRSAPNRTDRFRRALFLTFNARREGDRREQYFAAKRALFPPEDERDGRTDYRTAGRQFNLGNPFV
jgi:ectoine hydroxylase-related dioxygenase (phytanoyl-CoA dioxygenase family)